VALGSGALSLGLMTLAPGDPTHLEEALFQTANGTGGALPPLRVPQQLGTPWLLPLMALFGFLTRRPHLAVSAGLALPLEKSLEVGVKYLTRRRRPSQAVDAELHDDAPPDGPSYPSGHAAIAACGAVLASPYLPEYAIPGLATAVCLTSLARVHQGAHFPLDPVGGVVIGVGVGAVLNYTFGRPPA
jgi:undecaprenyl-diphosphatase